MTTGADWQQNKGQCQKFYENSALEGCVLAKIKEMPSQSRLTNMSMV